MAVQTFSLSVVQKVRQHLQAQLALPPSEQHPVKDDTASVNANPVEPTSLDALGDLFRVGGFIDEESPAPNAEGRWFISTIDPAAALHKLPGLSLKPGVRLVTYLQRRPGSGMGVTWALPEMLSTTAHLEAAIAAAGNGAIPPHPKGALGNPMDAIQGDDSPASFLAASLLLRELKEVGRAGANRHWSHHRLIDAVPTQYAWQWRTRQPSNLVPKLKRQADQSVLVEFFSCRKVPPIAIFRHLDCYGPHSYRPKTHDQVIALLEQPSRVKSQVR